jgi:DNA (cytosine-5)-methyltransferase 1
MKYATLCSGIEAPSMGWHKLGWKPAFFSEIEPFPKAVLKHHYPEVPDYGDMNNYKQWDYEPVDLICAGTPCQSFSIAGLRKGIEDPRGNLTLVFLGVLQKYRPKWVVWENVPGVLSDRSNAFGQFIAGLSELGYGVSWRVLDAQYYGVAQRRRRVFVVGYLGDWRPSASVLFDRHSLSGDSAPSREKRQGTTGSTQTCVGTGGEGGTVVTMATGQANSEINNDKSPTLNCNHEAPIIFEPRPPDGVPRISKDISPTLNSMGGGQGYLGQDETAFTLDTTQSQNLMHTTIGFLPGQGAGAGTIGVQDEQAPTLRAGCDNYGVMHHTAIRRLTPIECERLQGFPDNYTQIPYRNKPAENCPDGPRYKALGNSMAVPVLKWLGERIDEVNKLLGSH